VFRGFRRGRIGNTVAGYAAVAWATYAVSCATHGIAPTAANAAEHEPNHQQNADVSALISNIALYALRPDWEKFDKSTGTEATSLMGTVHPQWSEAITPPFPDTWPPSNKLRRISYYAYAQYGVALQHGPKISYSAPWARVVLRDGKTPTKEIYRKSIGSVIWERASVLWSAQHARKYLEIQKSGEQEIPLFLSWTSLPAEGDPAVQAIRDYYCQWKSDMGSLASKVMENYREFTAWLSCPDLAPADRGVFP
jgi:hypothetical protein